jgi:hypothetical protein
MGFRCASLPYFFDLLQRNRVRAAAAIDVSGSLYQFADERQALWAHIDVGHLGRDGWYTRSSFVKTTSGEPPRTQASTHPLGSGWTTSWKRCRQPLWRTYPTMPTVGATFCLGPWANIAAAARKTPVTPVAMVSMSSPVEAWDWDHRASANQTSAGNTSMLKCISKYGC